MGNNHAKIAYNEHPSDETYYELQEQINFQRSVQLPLEVLVHHFTPSSFPLLPLISRDNTELIRESWKKIVKNDIPGENGTSQSGITAFYNEFYERLEQHDSTGKFDAVLSRHAGGKNKIAAKVMNLLTCLYLH